MPFPTFPNLITQFRSAGIESAYRWFSTDLPNYIKGIINEDGSVKPAHLSDTEAKNDSIYYSTTTNLLSFKDPSGAVHNLY